MNYSKRYLTKYYNQEVQRPDSHLFIAGLSLMVIVLVALTVK